MGGCASTHHQHPPSLAGKPHNRSQQILFLLSANKHKESNLPPPAPQRPELVRVICDDGRVEEFKPPVTAAQAAATTGEKRGGAYLCSWESMYVDACAPEVAAAEELKAGQVYFVMPKSMAEKPLSLHEMCGLAIKASSGLSLADFHSSFRH